MTTREIQGHLGEIYGVEVSPTLISNVTDAVTEEVKQWQSRPLEALYPIVYLYTLMVNVRDEGHIQNKAIYVVLGVDPEGQQEVLGLWVVQSEGAKFWLQVLTELKNRGVQDILIACVDGLKGFPEAIEAVYPRTEVQLCIVHLVRTSLNYVPWKADKEMAVDLKAIYARPRRKKPRSSCKHWKRNGKRIPASARCGGAIGRASRRFSSIRRRFGARSTPPTAWSR